MTTPEALAALDSILFQLDAIPPDLIPRGASAYGPRFMLAESRSHLQAVLKLSRAWLERPPEAKKGRLTR